MSNFYLGDPCYVIPDSEWDDFCKIMRTDGEEFQYKGETCVVIGTGGDGDFDGLSVDAGIIGCIPVSLCDPASLEAYVPSDARLVKRQVSLEWEDYWVFIDGEPIGGQYCECSYCGGSSNLGAEHDFEDCRNCGTSTHYQCIIDHNGENYCSDDCIPKKECEGCYCELDYDDNDACSDCLYHDDCGCEKDDYSDKSSNCEDCQANIDEEE